MLSRTITIQITHFSTFTRICMELNIAHLFYIKYENFLFSLIFPCCYTPKYFFASSSVIFCIYKNLFASVGNRAKQTLFAFNLLLFASRENLWTLFYRKRKFPIHFRSHTYIQYSDSAGKFIGRFLGQ
jgi:hypothetical protein